MRVQRTELYARDWFWRIEYQSDDVMAFCYCIVMVPNKRSLHQALVSGLEPGTFIVSNHCDHRSSGCQKLFRTSFHAYMMNGCDVTLQYSIGSGDLAANTPFNNSLVRTRPALSRKILSLWMARAKLARAILVLLLSAPEQRQARARRGPKSFWTKQRQARG